MKLSRFLLLLIALPVLAQTTDKMSEDFRMAGLRATRAIHVRLAGSSELIDRDAIKAVDEADIQRKTPADDKAFRQIKDYVVTAELAQDEIANARIKAMIKARQTGKSILPSDTMPDTESVRKEKSCREELEKELRSGVVTDVNCK